MFLHVQKVEYLLVIDAGLESVGNSFLLNGYENKFAKQLYSV